MKRWTYLIPRLIILALVVVALWAGKDPLIRFVAIRSLQSATGAKVEIGQLRSSLANQRIFLKEVAIADPASPLTNLAQAEVVYLEFDLDDLLRRRLVVEHCQTSQIVFGSPRTVSGQLDESTVAVSNQQPFWEPKKFVPIEQLGRDWVDQLQPANHEAPVPEDFELVRVTQQLQPYWNQEFPAVNAELDTLHAMRVQLKSAAQSDLKNTLRRKLKDPEGDLAAILQRSLALEERITSLYESVDTNRNALQDAFNRDAVKLQQQKKSVDFDEDQISQLLLTQLQEQHLAEIIGWFVWFRSSVPEISSDFQPTHQRGVNVPIPGMKQQPGFLLKTIELEGEGRFANQDFDFAGTAHNLTSQPDLHDLPATFELRAQGNQHVIISCTLDRREGQAIDKLKIICPDLELDAQSLGERKSVLVTMGPASKIQAEIEIEATGNQLTGELVFRYSNVSLHVDKIHEMAGGESTALQLNQGLASVDHFETRIQLSGTFDDYQFDFESDLGSRFASSANSLMVEASHLQIERQISELEKLKSAQIGTLDHQITNQLHQLQKRLSQETAEIASLREFIPDPQSRLKIR